MLANRFFEGLVGYAGPYVSAPAAYSSPKRSFTNRTSSPSPAGDGPALVIVRGRPSPYRRKTPGSQPAGFCGAAVPAPLPRLAARTDRRSAPEPRAIWDKVFGHKWLAENCVMPHMIPRPGRMTPRSDINPVFAGAELRPRTNPDEYWFGAAAIWVVPNVIPQGELPAGDTTWGCDCVIFLDENPYPSEQPRNRRKE